MVTRVMFYSLLGAAVFTVVACSFFPDELIDILSGDWSKKEGWRRRRAPVTKFSAGGQRRKALGAPRQSRG